MQQEAISILERHGLMCLATVRPDGWPQATMVNYVNQGFTLYFMVSRTSQKFANIEADNRVSVAIGAEVIDPKTIEGLSLAAHAEEVRDEPYRSQFAARLAERHPRYFDLKHLDFSVSALMRARPEIVSIVDFSKGLGHTDSITLGPNDLIMMDAARPDNWGPNSQSVS
jgi:hypothetical protein